MTAPRRLLPPEADLPQLHATSRRTLERRFYLTPTPFTARLLRYLVLLAASRHQDAFDLYAYCALSNHVHAVEGDAQGGADSHVPRFHQDVHSLAANALNHRFDRTGVLWNPSRSYTNVEIHNQASLEDQLVYVWTQPVAAGLVKHPEDWPGFMILPEDIGRTLTAERPPEANFGPRRPNTPRPRPIDEARAALHAQSQSEQDRRRGRTARRRRQLAQERRRRQANEAEEARQQALPTSTLPDLVRYTIPVPPGFRDAEHARTHLRQRLDARLAEIHAERAAQGLGYLGVDAILAQDPHASAGPEERSDYVPRIACQGEPERYLELLEGLADWELSHRAGVKVLLDPTLTAPWTAVFPAGTHQRAQELRRLQAAKRAPP